uniref:Uncharacterized protein n=1 Tax=Helianthus annuus TaxID=4232 RepID=A0A251U3W8_HELAN
MQNRFGFFSFCVDDSGTWGHGGMYDALARLSSQIPEAYEHASEFGDLHLGDLHLLEITGEDEENKDGNANHWVALAVVQTYNPRRKVPRSSISIPELEQCLSKASFSAAQKGRLRSTCRELVIRMGQTGQKGTRLNVLLGNMLLILHKDICVSPFRTTQQNVIILLHRHEGFMNQKAYMA